MMHLIMEGHVTCYHMLPQPPDYGTTCYISPHAATTTWLQKDKLHVISCWYTHLITEGWKIHVTSCCHTHLIMEGQLTYPLPWFACLFIHFSYSFIWAKFGPVFLVMNNGQSLLSAFFDLWYLSHKRDMKIILYSSIQ